MAGSEENNPGAKEGKLLAHSFVHLMVSQVSSRALSFIFNLLIARSLSPDEFGLSAVQFQLLTSTILIVRDGFRRGCIRQNDQVPPGAAAYNKVVAVAWLSVPLGFCIALGACQLIFSWQSLALDDPYARAILLHGLAAMIEFLSEPLYILAQCLVLLRLRVAVEEGRPGVCIR